MKIFSKTHSIGASAKAAEVVPKGANGKPLAETVLVQHPAGTLLNLPDDQADDLISRNLAVEYDEKSHGKAKDGVVDVTRAQVVAPPLPEGMTHPMVVRQDETLNDGPAGTPPKVAETPVVIRDTKDDADKVKADEERAKALKAAETNAAAGGAGAAPGVVVPGRLPA